MNIKELKSSNLESVNSCLVVKCSSVGNTDYGQNSKKSISKTINVPCENFGQASEICRNYIDRFNLGGGNWTGGKIYHPAKGYIAYVSYNGRVWKNLEDDSNIKNWIELDKNANDC